MRQGIYFALFGKFTCIGGLFIAKLQFPASTLSVSLLLKSNVHTSVEFQASGGAPCLARYAFLSKTMCCVSSNEAGTKGWTTHVTDSTVLFNLLLDSRWCEAVFPSMKLPNTRGKPVTNARRVPTRKRRARWRIEFMMVWRNRLI